RPRRNLKRSETPRIARFAMRRGANGTELSSLYSRGVDFSMIPRADRKRAVIGLRHVPTITIVRGKHTSLAITKRSEAFGQCAVDDFDIQFPHAFDLEDTFRWACGHNC